MVYTWFLVISVINLCKNTPNLSSSQFSEILVHKWLRYLSLGTAVMTAGDFHSYLPIQKILIPPIQNSAPPRKIGKLLGQQLSDKLINLIAFGIISIIIQNLIQLITYRKYKEKIQLYQIFGINSNRFKFNKNDFMATIIFIVIINSGTLNWITGASQTVIELTKEVVGKIETPWIIYFNLILIGILQQTKRKTPSELQREKLKSQELKSSLGVYSSENSIKLNNLNIYSQDSKSGAFYRQAVS